MSWNRKQQMNAYRCASVEQGVRLGNLDLAHGKPCHAVALLIIFAKFLVSIATSKKIIEYLIQAESKALSLNIAQYIRAIACLVQCGQDWISWDNNCYRHGQSSENFFTIEDRRDDAVDYCAKEFEAEVFVPNSRDESEFIATYLKGRTVSFLDEPTKING